MNNLTLRCLSDLMRENLRQRVALLMPLVLSCAVFAGEEGWDNLDPARREREPARLYWEAPLTKGAAAFTVEKCGGAEGEVSFADGAMTARRTSAAGS